MMWALKPVKGVNLSNFLSAESIDPSGAGADTFICFDAFAFKRSATEWVFLHTK